MILLLKLVKVYRIWFTWLYNYISNSVFSFKIIIGTKKYKFNQKIWCTIKFNPENKIELDIIGSNI